jgi:hypothetical protein
MDSAGGSSLVTLADLNNWTLNMGRDRVDVTCFADTNKQRVMGLPDFSGTIGGVYNFTGGSAGIFFAAVLAGTAVTLRLLPDSGQATNYFQGLANLDGAISVSNTGAVTISGNWDAAGNWTMAP